jgi:hypothetical protein
MFGWLRKKKPTAKAHIKITHKSGETIVVTVEGTNVNHIAHVANRIKEIFNLRNSPGVDINAEKFWKESENLWTEFGNMMNVMNESMNRNTDKKEKYDRHDNY